MDRVEDERERQQRRGREVQPEAADVRDTAPSGSGAISAASRFARLAQPLDLARQRAVRWVQLPRAQQRPERLAQRAAGRGAACAQFQ